ncbi:MAG: hypothetical protein RBR74_13115, partial [Ignavibacteriaceae bacterium]|nr:hypothetical protein [Ignavibacteriaceae bacterium]
VLNSEENEFKVFNPQTKNESKQLELSEIPFVRLRPLISPEIKDQNLLKHKFDEIVSITQTQLKILSDKTKLIVDIERRELRYGNEIVSLEPMEFLFYYFFIDLNNRGIKNISVEQFTADETKIKFAEYFEEYYPNIYIKEKRWFKKGFSKEDFRTKRSKVNSKISELIEDNDAASVFIINSARKWGDSKYFIQADKNRFVVKL